MVDIFTFSYNWDFLENFLDLLLVSIFIISSVLESINL